MKYEQGILGFGRKRIEYCIKCDMKYNTTNRNDVELHRRIHKGNLIPKCTKICSGLHQRGNTFYYGEREIEARCTVRWKDGEVAVKGLWSVGEESKERILSLIRGLYGNIS